MGESDGSVADLRPRQEERGKPTLPRVLVNCDDRAVDLDPSIGALKSTTRFRALIPALKSDYRREEA